jgi:hypothetical protein
MSLKAFHVFFIFVSIVMCLAIGAFRAQAWSESGDLGALAQAAVSGAAGGGLIVYLWRFLKKTKTLGYLGLLLPLFSVELLSAATSAEACSVCFGDPTTPQSQAMRVGIFVLLGFIGSVLAGFASLFLYWMSRSRRLALMEKGATH